MSYSTERAFLNSKSVDSSANYMWAIYAAYGTFSISDCQNKVTLYFDLDIPYEKTYASKKEKDKALNNLIKSYLQTSKKFETVIDAFTRFKVKLDLRYAAGIKKLESIPIKEINKKVKISKKEL